MSAAAVLLRGRAGELTVGEAGGERQRLPLRSLFLFRALAGP